ncbi:hypothetical protein LCI18_002557 [Fusarium solani-melongenae]|uniref:Uncharacterized protein n=1 Tax=Fusarium solani subsp. cucurbitae TaxID=2747967 RepID=A0ACD3YRH5_FUSSC|nr:hypothetical protein LCI18_002557 [Fusarium solani-melongenae]
MASQYLSFDSLPLDKNGPHGNTWGLWGPDDQLGTLNLLTDEVISEAAKENIKMGSRVSLNWSMTGASYPKFARKLLDLHLINKAPLKHAHDDEVWLQMSRYNCTLIPLQWTFNSQCSSQWDGFRHYAYQNEAVSISYVSAKGIAGRAIFIDWYAWAQKQGLKVDARSSHEVPFSELVETLKFQGMDLDVFRPGDIVVVRFGYLEQYENMSQEKRQHLDNLYKTQKPDNIGLKPSEELLRFLWDRKIAAICGDSRSLEVWPCKDTEWHLHEWLLAGWGMPIGELFYLEELAKMCSSSGRYTFFMSSSPMNVPGAVASPPNALAFF